jgi:hypothetical protein
MTFHYKPPLKEKDFWVDFASADITRWKIWASFGKSPFAEGSVALCLCVQFSPGGSFYAAGPEDNLRIPTNSDPELVWAFDEVPLGDLKYIQVGNEGVRRLYSTLLAEIQRQFPNS